MATDGKRVTSKLASKFVIFAQHVKVYCDLCGRKVYCVFCNLDEIIRKRLLIDGEGAGDDRRITALLKTFLKWCNSTGAEEGDR